MEDDSLRCAHCGDVIGMYEPLVVIEVGHARETSRTAEPWLTSGMGEHYHGACHVARGAEDSPPFEEA